MMQKLSEVFPKAYEAKPKPYGKPYLGCEYVVVVLQVGLNCCKIDHFTHTPLGAKEHRQTGGVQTFWQKHLEICPFGLGKYTALKTLTLTIELVINKKVTYISDPI